MRMRTVFVLLATLALCGCSHLWCARDCESTSRNSSSLVDFLYPDGKVPPPSDAIPQLRVPLRVGLAFLPSKAGDGSIAAANRDPLLERIRQRFSDRKFVSEIIVIPDYYLTNTRGYGGLASVQRLYNIDVMALVSYDQVRHTDDNNWSLGYLTIVGAYVLKGSRHDVSTLVDLAVVDPTTQSLIIRAGGVDTRDGNATAIELDRELRDASLRSFGVATDQMIERFDAELKQFEVRVKEGKAPIRVVQRESRGGGGSLGIMAAAVLLCLARARRTSRSGASRS